MKRDFSERITVKSILIPTECTNYEGLTTMKVISIDENSIIQQNPAKYDFIMYKNLPFNITLIHKNELFKSPNDLSDFTIEGKAFLINNKEIEYDLHPIIIEPTSGKIIIELTPEETNNFIIDETECITYYHYYINLISSTGYKYRILVGNIKLCQ